VAGWACWASPAGSPATPADRPGSSQAASANRQPRSGR
jgi:hypothetical protein